MKFLFLALLGFSFAAQASNEELDKALKPTLLEIFAEKGIELDESSINIIHSKALGKLGEFIAAPFVNRRVVNVSAHTVQGLTYFCDVGYDVESLAVKVVEYCRVNDASYYRWQFYVD